MSRLPAWADHLSEGVLLLDREGKILAENARVRELFSRGGAYLWERVRRHEIFAFLDELEKRAEALLLLHRPSGVLEFRGFREGENRWVFVRPRPDVNLRENQRALFSQISHELRTPLANIRMAFDLFQGGAMERETFLATIGRNLERIETLVELLSRQHKVETWTPVFEEGNWCAEVSTILRAFHARVEAAGLVLSLDCALPEKLPLERFLLSTILFPLLDNAVRYTPPGGQIRVCLEAEGGNIRLVVEDTGRGIPVHIRDRVFDPFVQHEGGTGLGLSLVRGAVTRWGGRIHLESQEGRGTRVTVVLPLPSGEGTGG